MGEPRGLRLRGGGARGRGAGTVPAPGPDEAGRAGVPRREAAVLRGRAAGGERDARQWTYKPRHPGCHPPLSGADSPEDRQTRCVPPPVPPLLCVPVPIAAVPAVTADVPVTPELCLSDQGFDVWHPGNTEALRTVHTHPLVQGTVPITDSKSVITRQIELNVQKITINCSKHRFFHFIM